MLPAVGASRGCARRRHPRAARQPSPDVRPDIRPAAHRERTCVRPSVAPFAGRCGTPRFPGSVVRVQSPRSRLRCDSLASLLPATLQDKHAALGTRPHEKSMSPLALAIVGLESPLHQETLLATRATSGWFGERQTLDCIRHMVLLSIAEDPLAARHHHGSLASGVIYEAPTEPGKPRHSPAPTDHHGGHAICPCVGFECCANLRLVTETSSAVPSWLGALFHTC
jgi:hypothetical protein